MRHLLRAGALAALASAALTPALAGDLGCAGDCYRKVHHPASYAAVNELYVARQGHTTSHYVPPRYDVVQEPMVLRPARTVARVTPAQYASVAERVLVSPARREWQVSLDAHGNEVGCWVEVPAAYAVKRRKVMVQPEQVTYVTVPEKVAFVQRRVMTSPGHVVKGRVPTVYETRTRSVKVAPAREAWEPVGHAPAPVEPAYGLSYVSTSVTVE